ncbi:hypothetical protein DERP_010574 [Dermatophagoides pteronyssinus]|uniref:Uncharacterized protein n=1 Tax=Dermatophagoides pteronyssinus TaxID=6956 RepID=A0ABQ8JG82_DERPT|nr:hypothetical protein DERP_010574 [Dermatophagoides pteronyssinus]
MDGKTALGASSPANPALHIPDPLSITKAATSSSHILADLNSKNLQENVIWFSLQQKKKFNKIGQ